MPKFKFKLSLVGYAQVGNLKRVRELIEQGADIEKANNIGWTPIIFASARGHLEVVRYLLEQGANRDKATNSGWTSLHLASEQGHLEIAKLLMVYGADLNARTNGGLLPIDMAGATEEIRQAIRDEPERRWNQQPRKRCIEQDRHPNTAASDSAQQDNEEVEQSNKKTAEEGAEVADEDQNSEPSSDEDGN